MADVLVQDVELVLGEGQEGEQPARLLQLVLQRQLGAEDLAPSRHKYLRLVAFQYPATITNDEIQIYLKKELTL